MFISKQESEETQELDISANTLMQQQPESMVNISIRASTFQIH